MKTHINTSSVVSRFKIMNLRPLAISCLSFMGTYALTASVVQASDLQIYATPEAGQKTIVMMLDTSGSMGDSDSGQTGSRLYRLKQGMYKLLESNDGNLANTKVGLGRFWGSSSRDGGYILVEAAKMGPVGSAHRQKLRTAVDGLKAEDWTPTAQAYVEAAAYLMGTNSLNRATIKVDAFRTLTQNEKTQDAKCPDATPYYRSSNNLCYQYRTWGWSGYSYSGVTAALIPERYEN